MFKNLIRLFLILLIMITLLISYLSIFGIKTDRFNEIVKSQITKQDKRIDIELVDVFIKLNLKERSISLNSKNVNLLILNEKQKFSNINLLISINSLFKNEKKIKKIVINSKEDEINKLLKFVKAYKLNIPALYLENILLSGNIIYDIVVNFNESKPKQIKISGKIIDTNLNVLSKQKIENINCEFDYYDQGLDIYNLKLKYKEIKFNSESISANMNNNLINIKGDFENIINQKLISDLFDYNFQEYFDEKINLSSKSVFEISFSKKLKLKDYKIKSKVNFKDFNLYLKKTTLKNYLKDFKDKIILKNGVLDLDINKQNKILIKINSKYIFSNKQKPKDISFQYLKNSKENYEMYMDLTENDLILDKIDFYKKKGDQFYLELKASKYKNLYEINDLKLFNTRDSFNLKKIKFGTKFKIRDFHTIKAKYINKKDFINEILITKINKNINLNSKSFDISSNIENSLKGTQKSSLLDIFHDLNSSININVEQAKIDDDHSLKNINGKTTIKNNKIYKATLSAKFDNKNNFNYTKDEIDGKKVTTIFSDIAKPFVKKFDFIKGFEDGKLDYTSTEVNEDLSRSELRIYNFKLQDTPVLTKLLSLASLQGIADLLTGEGIRFNEFDMYFDNTQNLITINEIYALGPAISILMEGYVEKNKLVSLRGTLVPATTINKTIAKIPLVGNILVGDKVGEGVFGVSFKIKGPPNNLDTRVNPIKTLTPRFITRTLENIKKTN